MKVTRLAYKVSKPLLRFFHDLYYPLKKLLRAARINKTVEEYMAIAVFSSIIAALVTFIILLILILKYYVLNIFSLFLITIFPMASFATVILIFYFYPIAKAQTRARKINNALPFATLYMSSIASSGSPPVAIFEFLANMKEFGELSAECKDIVYMSKVLGVDLPTTLEKIANRSPSKEWKDLLYSVRTILIEGGDLSGLLYEKAKSYIAEFRRKIVEYARTVSLLLEIYITLVIVGVVFILVISSIIVLVSPAFAPVIYSVQLFVVGFGLPMVSIMFIILLKAISPFET